MMDVPGAGNPGGVAFSLQLESNGIQVTRSLLYPEPVNVVGKHQVVAFPPPR